jgi:CHASE1-domain containing sensor protein
VEASPTATLEPAGESQITLGMIGLGIVLVGIIGLIVTAFIYLRRRR